jgi:hypothetical protein
MLLSALTARDKLAGKNPPMEGYAAAAEELRQEILFLIHADLQDCISYLERRLIAIGLPQEEIATIVEKAKSLSERGVNPQLDKEEIAELRAQLLPKIASWLKADEDLDAVNVEYNDLTETIDEISNISFLHKHSATGEPLYIEIAGFLSQIFGRDIAVVVKSSKSSCVYYFQKDGLRRGELEGELEDVIEEWKAQYSGMSDRPIILELSGNDRSGHYRAFVPKD